MWLYRTCFRVDGEIWLSLQNTVDYSGTVAIGGVVSIARCDLQHGRSCEQKEHFRSTVRISKQAACASDLPIHITRLMFPGSLSFCQVKKKKTKLEELLNLQASAKARLRWEIHGASEPCWSFGMLSACIFFVPVPCLAEADAALMVVKYELISADLMLDPAHISIAKQGGWLLYPCCINSSLLRVAFKPHISLVASYVHV